nr:L-fuculokinase [uncultured Cohaesibacter sp.]
MTEDVVIVLDCGATNVRAIAVDISGKVIARASEPNVTESDADHADWHYWPFEGIYEKFCRCCRKVGSEIGAQRVKAVSVTTFGVDGTFIDQAGSLLYPVVSWKCPRTIDAQNHMARYIDPDRAVALSGVGHFSFNTLNKFIWMKENRPDILDSAKHFLFISSLFTHRLTGRATADATMVGTSQMTDMQAQDMSEEILGNLQVDRSLFPDFVYPGEVIGTLLPKEAEALGLPCGVPVVSAGHDTQFAVFGAGAAPGQPVLSSGTWEILMARCESVKLPSKAIYDQAFTCEWDVERGHYNPGIQYLASAVVEWVARTLFSELSGPEKYDVMIREAMQSPQDCRGVSFYPDLLTNQNGGQGMVQGLSLAADRGTIFRAALTGLVGRLQDSLTILEEVGAFKTTELTLVGGGARNAFWTQLKANALNVPVKTLEEPETTVLGAAMFAMQGAGLYETATQARENFNLRYVTTLPQAQQS